ncbi:hypothetical protein A9G30_04785 [Gilliamella sp. Fer4-1]|nr:hypothetical protein A9G30_04785 [Gilliamella apicola]
MLPDANSALTTMPIASYPPPSSLNGYPEELTDENGNILWECSFQLWGKRDQEIELQSIKQNLRYQEQYLDRKTDLHYNTFRYYELDIGYFT